MHRNDSEVLMETRSVYDPATNSRTKRFLFSFNSGSNTEAAGSAQLLTVRYRAGLVGHSRTQSAEVRSESVPEVLKQMCFRHLVFNSQPLRRYSKHTCRNTFLKI